MSVVNLQELKEELRRPDMYYAELGDTIIDVERLVNIQEIVWKDLLQQKLERNQLSGYTVLTLTEGQIDALYFLITQLQGACGTLSKEWERLTNDFIAVSSSEKSEVSA